MRGLFMDFPDDERVHDINNQYMFGRSFLVTPVAKPMYVNKWKRVRLRNVQTQEVYLPRGTNWYDFWAGEKFVGGQTVEKMVPIDIIPLYVRAGTILPIGPKVQYATKKRWDDLEIRIYQGADGSFSLYEDDNYNYEDGAYGTMKIKPL